MKKSKLTGVCVVVNFIAQMVVFVHGEATLEVHMLTYRNPTGSVSGPGSCDVRYLGKYWRCDTFFNICFTNNLGYFDNFGACNYFYAETGYYQDQNDIVFGKDIKSVRNPIKVHLDVLPGSIHFEVVARDKDNIKFILDPFIDWLDVTWKMKAARNISQSKWSDTQVITGSRGNDPTKLTVQYRLYCNQNYYNTSCDRHCVASNDPKKHTLCDPATGAELCQHGWEGSDCDVVSDDCIDNKCTNEASCKDGHRKYTCTCVPGFTGRFCEIDINECASGPCLNGGRCVDKIGSFACVCKRGYFDGTCSQNKCDSANSPCMNYGTCFIDTKNQAGCICSTAFTGDVCEREKCSDVVCQNGGICKDGVCKCQQGYVGQFCDVILCDQMDCMNGGSCTDGKCFCLQGYTGVYCQNKVRSDPGNGRGPAYTVNDDNDDIDPPHPGQRGEDGHLARDDQATTSHEENHPSRGPETSRSLPVILGVVLTTLMHTIW